ncbi:cytochrome P450 [Dendrothele bispora CBS 962.96]|uniref:Cytochrome P450 n=1 Tax=Dendrothele bispora (strain CBS 962.96) TaxID=1314807 RepID=A0A4S8LQ42_DENBC|nr:cytochrome P450 [Dendrothele bispora CBS 962.96]
MLEAESAFTSFFDHIRDSPLLALAFLSFLIFYPLRVLYVNRRSLPLPPGPPKFPLIGNLLDIPTSKEWDIYHSWAAQYNSDIIHVGVAGTSLIILDKVEAARELFDKRSLKYSSRPQLTMLTELMGWDYSFVMMNYGEKWRTHRKLAQKGFLPSAVLQFQDAELRATHTLLKRLAICGANSKPVDMITELKQMTGSIILSVAYGIEVLPQNDPYIAAADAALDTFCIAARPGSFLVDAIPWLKYVPEWMPGAGFKRKAKEWRKLARRMIEMPFETARKNYEANVPSSSFVANALEDLEHEIKHSEHGTKTRETAEEDLKSVAGALYTGGVDSTLAVITHFVCAMLRYPDVQTKAQKELDSILGMGTLPKFEDEKRLPYVTAVVKEAFRWRNVAPMGFPHMLDEEDEYNGYRIPKHSIVLPNMWAMFHNEEVYPDPEPFKPERFLHPDGTLNGAVQAPEEIVFGFGRRICPARYMAYSSIWITIASLLSTYDISKARDEQGNIIEPSYECTSTLAYMPVPFKCSITPRNESTEEAVKQLQ